MNVNSYQQHIQKKFAQYTSAYDITDPKIKLKIAHTYRVAELCDKIADSLGLNEVDRILAWTCGMLHDIGRFEQVTRYGTFIDSQSVDHARFGADLLFEEGLYERFGVDEESKELRLGQTAWRTLIETAIRQHNVFRVAEGLDERELLFTNILRDADKVDIYRVNCETSLEDIYNVSTEELRQASVTEAARRAFSERHCVKRSSDLSSVDHVVGHICLFFELVFEKSRQEALSQGYLTQLLHFQSANPETEAWFAHMREYFDEERSRGD